MKMKKDKKKNILYSRSLLFQYIASYMLILSIPLILLSLFIQFRYRSTLISEFQKNNEYVLSISSAKLDKTINSYQNIVYKLSLDGYFFSAPSPSMVNETYNIKEQLEQYAIATDLSMIAIYWHDSAYLYSNLGTSTVNLLSEPILNNLRYDTGEFKIFTSDFLPYFNSKEPYIIYAFPFSGSTGTNSKGYILFAQTSSQFIDNISFSDLENQQLFLYSSNLNLIYGNSELDATLKNEFNSCKPDTDFRTASFYDKNKRYLFCTVHSSDWQYYLFSIAPVNYALTGVKRLQIETFLCIFASFLFASLLTVLMIHYNYRPVQKLITSIEHLFNSDQQKLNKVVAAQQVVHSLADQNDDLKKLNQRLSHAQIVRKLLEGSASEAEIYEIVSSYQSVFQSENFCVCCLYPEDTKKFSEEFLPISKQAFDIYFPTHLITENHIHSFVAIINFDENEEELCQHLSEIRDTLSKKLQCPLTLTCGSVCTSLEQLSQSYTDAIYALDYRYVKGTDCLILYEEIPVQDELYNNYPYLELERLRDCLSQRNLKSINKQLNSILNYITDCEVPLFVARRISYDIINIVLNSLNDKELSENCTYISSLSKFDTIQDLTTAVYNIYNNLVALSGENESEQVSTLNEMKDYIQKHYTNPEFSLQTMAEYFGMTLTGLSQYFKNKSGQTLIDYYSSLRLELAKTLLATQKYKVDEVAAMIGYHNTSSFIRRFKQLTGISPGQFSQQANSK